MKKIVSHSMLSLAILTLGCTNVSGVTRSQSQFLSNEPAAGSPLVRNVEAAEEGGRQAAPKKVVAVIDFENKANIPGTIQLGTGMADMLSDALIRSGQFVVVERQNLGAVLAEQDLAASGRTTAVGGAKKGAVSRAQILITGAITEYDVDVSGGEQAVQIPGGSLKAKSDKAHVAVILRLVDSTTSQVLGSQRVEGSASRGGLQIDLGSGSWGFSNLGKQAMPLDKAVQIAIDNAVNFVSAQLARLPWQGKVIKVEDGGVVYLNAGSDANMVRGTILKLYRQAEEIVDPDTGLSLGFDETFLGRLEVTEVLPKFSKGKMLDASSPEPGDLLKYFS